jgi:hypothetical protein
VTAKQGMDVTVIIKNCRQLLFNGSFTFYQLKFPGIVSSRARRKSRLRLVG